MNAISSFVSCIWRWHPPEVPTKMARLHEISGHSSHKVTVLHTTPCTMSENSGNMNDQNGTNNAKYTSFRATADMFVPSPRKSNMFNSAAGTTTSHHPHLDFVPRPPYAGYIQKPISSPVSPESFAPIQFRTAKCVPNRSARRGGRNKAEERKMFRNHMGCYKEPSGVQRPSRDPKVGSFSDEDGILRSISPPILKDAEPFREQLESITKQIAIMGRYRQLELARRASNMVYASRTGRQGLHGTGAGQAQNVDAH
jgi:hypothetical protein